jgi:hypothetical protein
MIESRHELQDSSPARAAIFTAFTLFLVAAVLAASLGVFHLFTDRESPNIQGSGLEVLTGTFPEPRLQTAPHDDLLRIQEKDRNLLRGYGWMDREHRVVRIPVDRAIDIALEKGLPEFPEGEQK